MSDFMSLAETELLASCFRLQKKVDELKELLRWRKWPEEKPTGMMPFWLVSDGSNVDIEWIWHERESVLEQSAKWWRPIGPLPGEGGEA